MYAPIRGPVFTMSFLKSIRGTLFSESTPSLSDCEQSPLSAASASGPSTPDTVLPDSDDTAFPRCSADDEHETHPNKDTLGTALNTKLHRKICSDAPVSMKNAQAVFLNGEIHVGGGYTGIADTDPVVFTYDPNFDHWGSLPASPMKWFGLAVFGEQLVVVGGKEVESREVSTNKLAVWDKDTSSWTFPFPSMLAARTSPTVFSYKSYLVAAGGKRGVLDYNIEILDSESMQWFQAPPLPRQCLPHTSLIHNNSWYLLSETLLQADMGPLILQAKEYSKKCYSHSTPESGLNSVWQSLERPPVSTLRVAAICDHIVAFSPTQVSGSPFTVHAYIPEASPSSKWKNIGKLPAACVNATCFSAPSGNLFLIGGDGWDLDYSNKVFQVSVRTSPRCKRVRLAPNAIVF